MITWEKLPEILGGTYVQVAWELGKMFDDDTTRHHTSGISKEGIKFVGTAIVENGEFVDVEDTECVAV